MHFGIAWYYYNNYGFGENLNYEISILMNPST